MYLVKKTFTFISAASIVVISLACQQKQIDPAENPKGLVEQMVAAIGGIDKLHSLKDVEYTYIYHDLTNDKKDISLEKYVFDGELSWAHYETREKNVMPQMEGEINQGFNGSESWMTIDGKLVDDNPQLAKLCDFLRKTNYYWFTMMFKLMDPGVQYKYSGTRTVDRVDYNLINISFGEEVGDVQDTYLLYINPETKLVDQFLFTVMDFGVAEPFLMKVEYEEIQGVKLPAKRKYVRANWDGEPQNDEWTAATWTNIKFNNGFDRSMFNKPTFQ